MSKFTKNNIIGNDTKKGVIDSNFVYNSGDNNIIGNNNTVTNQTNKTIHTYSGSNRNIDQTAFPVAAIITFLFFTLGIHSIFQYFEQLSFILIDISIASLILNIIGYFILYSRKEVESRDQVYCFISIFFVVLTVFSIYMLKELLPQELISIVLNNSSIISLLKNLSGVGQSMMFATCLSILILFFCVLINLWISMKQFSYSLANSNRIGFWYFIFKIMAKPIRLWLFLLEAVILVIFFVAFYNYII